MAKLLEWNTPESIFAVHLDHGDEKTCYDCIDSGFYSSVMIDASHDPFEKNIEITKRVTDKAHAKGISVEAELGMLGGVEEDIKVEDGHATLTNPAAAEDFVKKTGCDSLACAIGTSHGAFKFKHEAKLAFDRIEQIMKTCPGLPLVMHGSSSVPQEFIDLVNKYGGNMPNAKGVPEDQISMAVQKYGVCKVNIDTDLRLAMTIPWGDLYTAYTFIAVPALALVVVKAFDLARPVEVAQVELAHDRERNGRHDHVREAVAVHVASGHANPAVPSRRVVPGAGGALEPAGLPQRGVGAPLAHAGGIEVRPVGGVQGHGLRLSAYLPVVGDPSLG